MTSKEIEQLSKLDEICNNLQCSYRIDVLYRVGVRITLFPNEEIKVEIGGLDYNFNRVLEKAIEKLQGFERRG